jgi:trk system potassium uptake protein TrkA
MKFIVFGLGNFGAALCEQMVEMGHEVIGVDSNLETVEKYKHRITHAIALDARNKEAVKQLPIKDLDAAIVGIGEDEGTAVMVTALLKQMGVQRIICRVTSSLQKIVFDAMDIHEFVYPESYAAERLALKLDMPGVVDSFKINMDYRMLEIRLPSRYIGETVARLNLAIRYKLVLVTILKKLSKTSIFGHETDDLQVTGIVAPDTVLVKDDVLLLFGMPKDLEKFILG